MCFASPNPRDKFQDAVVVVPKRPNPIVENARQAEEVVVRQLKDEPLDYEDTEYVDPIDEAMEVHDVREKDGGRAPMQAWDDREASTRPVAQRRPGGVPLVKQTTNSWKRDEEMDDEFDDRCPPHIAFCNIHMSEHAIG